jgi:hypothetical protein
MMTDTSAFDTAITTYHDAEQAILIAEQHLATYQAAEHTVRAQLADAVRQGAEVQAIGEQLLIAERAVQSATAILEQRRAERDAARSTMNAAGRDLGIRTAQEQVANLDRHRGELLAQWHDLLTQTAQLVTATRSHNDAIIDAVRALKRAQDTQVTGSFRAQAADYLCLPATFARQEINDPALAVILVPSDLATESPANTRDLLARIKV